MRPKNRLVNTGLSGFRWGAFIVILSVLVLLSSIGSSVRAEKIDIPGGSSLPSAPGIEGQTYNGEKVKPAGYNGDVRKLPPVPSKPKIELDLHEPHSTKRSPSNVIAPETPNLSLAPMPGPLQNFAGLNFDDSCTGGRCGAGWPPDINGDVGPNHYIEAVNDAFAIYSKTGTLLASFTENSLF